MKATQKLQDLGQSLWLDNISREILTNGALARYISDLSVTGLTSNPTIFEHAIGNGSLYDEAIGSLARQGKAGEELFFALALDDLRQAADLFRPIFEATDGVDGWVSLEVSPLLVADTVKTIQAAAGLHAAAARPNLFIKIPGTPAGIPAIEESIFAGVPINVTLLFSREQYLAATEAYLRGIERRLFAGLDPKVESVASLFVSRWDVAVKENSSPQYHNRLGIAIAMRTYQAYRELLASARWQKLAKAGAHPQRLLWASTGVRTRQYPTRSTSKRLVPPIRSTRPQKKHYSRSPTTAKSVLRCRQTGAMPRQSSKNSGAKALTRMRWPRGCNSKAQMPSRNRGSRYCRASGKKVRNSPG